MPRPSAPLVALVAVASLAGCKSRELKRCCESFERAEREFAGDYKQASDHAANDFNTKFPELREYLLGLRGFKPSIRYPEMLRFAHVQLGIEQWVCPAMDRLWMREQQAAAASPAGDSDRWIVITVSLEGEVRIRGKPVPPGELERAITELKDQQEFPSVSLHRAGWDATPHRRAQEVLDLLIAKRITVGLCARADCLEPL